MTESGKRVCVTGAGGYIGSHVTRELLQRGHHVRATVRDPSDSKKNAHLRALVPDAGERLELFAADLMKPGSFDVAVRGCEWVFHIASAVQLNAKDPQREIIDVAVQGTENVLASIEKAGTVKRVGLTSSIAAVGSTADRPLHTYTEDDWCEDATVASNPYAVSKVLAEKAVWAAKERLGFDLTVVNPVLVFGPVYAEIHVRSSTTLLHSFFTGKLPACPKLAFGIVDVRDVTLAICNGVERGVNGRFILCKESMWAREIALVVKERYPNVPVRTFEVPNAFVYASALFDKRLSFAYLKRNLNRMDRFDGSKVTSELGVNLRSTRESILDTCESLIAGGYVPAPK